MKKCPKCGAKLQKGRRRCPECGGFVAGSKLQKVNKKTWMLGGACALLVLVIALIALLSGGEDKSTVYVKGGEMSFVEASSKKPLDLTKELVYENSLDQFDLEYMSNYYYSKMVKMTKKGDRIFYPSNIIRMNNYTLTYRDLKDKDSEVIKVAEGVSDYKISENGKVVVYLSEGTLSRYDEEGSQILKKGVVKFAISKDGKKILFVDNANSIHLVQNGKTKKLVKEIHSCEYISEDFKTIYYTKNADLYQKEIGGDAKKLASKVYSVLKVYDSGEVYYLKENAEKTLASNYVENDTKNAKLQKELKSHEIETHVYELFYHNGKNSKSVAKDVKQENIKIATEKPVIVYTACDMSKVKKLKLSEITSPYEVEGAVFSMTSKSNEYFVASGTKTRKIEEKNVENIILSKTGTTVYYVADVPDEKAGLYDATGKLYKISVSDNKVGASKKFASDVFAREIDFVGAEGVLYYKNVSEVEHTMQGDLYVNKKVAEGKVKLGSAVCYDEVDDSTVYFLTDWRYQESMGTLKKVKGSKVSEIRKSANSFYSMKKGEVLFISNYNVDTYAGDLYMHVRGKAHKIDKDVVAIMQNRE